MSLLEISHLCTTFHTRHGIVHAVNDVSFDVDAGEIVGIVGESGCGKTVLCQSVLGLIPMSFFPGEGAELVQPIGKTVVGGLTVSAVLTLFLIPVIYAMLNTFSEKRRQRRQERRIRRMEKRRAAGETT